jgi:hypothetical protein
VLKNNLTGIAGTFVVVSLLQLAYASPKFSAYPVRKASACAATVQRAGLVIGVQPLEDMNEQKTYFKVELTPKGFIPVYIVLENGSSRDSFLFDKADVGYAAVSNTADANARSAAGEGMASAGFGGLIALNLITRATEVQQNILKKEVQSATLSPGATVYGFLYIPVPKKGPRQKIHLQVPITKAGTSETHVLNVFF